MDLERRSTSEPSYKRDQSIVNSQERSEVDLGGTRTSFLFCFPGTGKNQKLEEPEDKLEESEDDIKV